MEQVLEICIQSLGLEKVMEICAAKKAAAAPRPIATPVQEKKTEVPNAPVKAAAPVVKVVKVHKVVKKTETAPEPAATRNLEADLAAVATEPAPATVPAPSAPKIVKKVAKKVVEGPRCDARIYGEKIDIEGSKAPNGSPLHCYKIAQCDRKGSETIPLDDGESEAHLCKVCIKHYNARSENPTAWHGLFDIDTAPETSHFVGGPWHSAVLAKVKKTEEASE